jgi:hypothetical protein
MRTHLLYTSFHVRCAHASLYITVKRQGVSPLSVRFTWINNFYLSITLIVPVMLCEFSKMPSRFLQLTVSDRESNANFNFRSLL